MNEGNIRNEIYRMLRYYYDLWPDHFADIPGIKKQPGRPDLVVMNPYGPGYYVEVKALNVARLTSFSFSEISEGQRKWLSLWEEACPNGAWLGLGVYGIRPRKLYMVPWPDWLMIEEALSLYQESLPYEAGPGYRTELQEQGLDFSLLESFSCPRVPPADRLERDPGWRIHPTLEHLWTSR